MGEYLFMIFLEFGTQYSLSLRVYLGWVNAIQQGSIKYK